MALTPTQLACNAQAICRCFKGNQALLMAAVIAYIADLTGMAIDCDTLMANAGQYQCIERQLQLPAVIWLLAQNVQYPQPPPPPPAPTPVAVFSGTGSPVGVVTPTATTAVYFDTTNSSFPVVWYWATELWTRFIG